LLYYAAGEALKGRVDLSRVRLHAMQKSSSLDLRLIAAIARLIDEHEIDVVHCTLQYSLLLAWAARMRARAKPSLVCAIHTTINVSAYHELADRALYRWLFRACTDLIFVCETQRVHWAKKYPELDSRSHVVFNGIDTGFFDPAAVTDPHAMREKLGIPDGAKVLSCVAAFRPEKAHHLLVAAFAQLISKRRDVQLVLAGDGPTRPGIERLVADLGLAAQVRFPGAVSDVRGLLASSDVTVLASTAVETFSMAMLESMAMGVPLVATDMGGTREAVLDGETGVLVPPNDVPALVRGLGRVFGDDAYRTRLGRNARQLVLDRFTEQRMVRETASLLDAVVARRRA
jgi:glycosyltransferase involved in cell wall biosynthesis